MYLKREHHSAGAVAGGKGEVGLGSLDIVDSVHLE